MRRQKKRRPGANPVSPLHSHCFPLFLLSLPSCLPDSYLPLCLFLTQEWEDPPLAGVSPALGTSCLLKRSCSWREMALESTKS